MRLVWYRGAWCVYWRDERKRPRRISLGTTDRGEAERRFRDWQADKQRTGPLETIGDIVDAWLADKEGQGKPSARISRYTWNRLRDDFGHLAPRHITRAVCRDYTARCRQDGLSDATIRYRLATMQAALRWHDKSHEAVFELPSEPPPRDRHLTIAERDRLLEAARSVPHVHLWCVLALTTGARAEAILQLTWQRVDLDRGRIDFGKGSGRKGRAQVPINETARAALVEAREAATTDYVIEYAGRPVKSIKRGFKAACERAGIEGVSPHVCRHSVAVWLAEAGTPMHEIAQMLGHTDTATTYRVYARYSPDHLRDAASALEAGPCSSSQEGSTRRRAK